MRHGRRLALLVLLLGTLLVPPTAAAPTVARVEGPDRVATAIALSVDAFPAADAVVIAHSRAFADALAAAPLAAAVAGPVLLNPQDELDARVAAELRRLDPSVVYLMGGEAAQAAEVEEALASRYDVVRLGGRDRFATAALAAAEAVDHWRAGGDETAGDHALVALGRHPTDDNRAWPDALVAGVLAGHAHRPILLTDRDEVPPATAAALDDLEVTTVTIVGGPAAIPEATAAEVAGSRARQRIGGADRYETGRLLADAAATAGADLDIALLATGVDFPDSLGAGPAAVAKGGVLLLVHPGDLDLSPASASRLWARRDTLTDVTVVGGESAVPAATLDQITGRVVGLEGYRLLKVVVGSFANPIMVAAPPGDGRLFVAERGTADAGRTGTYGRILIVRGRDVAPVPFLEVATRTDGERGLLGFAFHPAFPTDPRVFVHYSDPVTGDTTLSEFHLSSDPDRLDPATEVVLRTVEQPASNHNGGTVTFGPDGMLYLFLGDGGGSDDQFRQAQDTSTRLGAALRMDVSDPGRSTPPSDNPFVGRAGEDLIWAYGLRNPYRAAFDRVTGDGFIADVGQSAREEIDHLQPGDAGRNFGWPCREGTVAGPRPSDCDPGTELTPPVYEYARSGGHCAIIGGEVERGRVTGQLRGHYFFGDLCSGMVGSFRLQDGEVVQLRDWTNDLRLGGITSFGFDGSGQVHVIERNTATVYRIAPR